jgi:hypothetical protein
MNRICFAAIAPCIPALITANMAGAVAYKATLLDSADFSYVEAKGVSGGSQAGYRYEAGPNGGIRHALFWSSPSANPVGLTPAGFDQSFADGVDGDIQVGRGSGL